MSPEEFKKYTTCARFLGLATAEEAKAQMDAERLAKRATEQAPPVTPAPTTAPVVVPPVAAAPAESPADDHGAVAPAPLESPPNPARPLPKHRVTRSPKTARSRFARIDNSVLQDKRLSFRARGLLAYILSNPVDWAYAAERMAKKDSPDGVDTLRAGLNELREFGYAELIPLRGEDGKTRNSWFFHEAPTREKPDLAEDSPSREKRHLANSGFTRLGLTKRGSTRRGKPPLLETTTIQETTVQETTIGKTTLSGSERLPLSFSLQEAQGLGAQDSPALAEAWSKWCRHSFEKKIPTRSTVEAHRTTFLQLGAEAPATVNHLIAAGLHRLEPRTGNTPAVPPSALSDPKTYAF